VEPEHRSGVLLFLTASTAGLFVGGMVRLMTGLLDRQPLQLTPSVAIAMAVAVALSLVIARRMPRFREDVPANPRAPAVAGAASRGFPTRNALRRTLIATVVVAALAIFLLPGTIAAAFVVSVAVLLRLVILVVFVWRSGV
jgi:hypothetical protein